MAEQLLKTACKNTQSLSKTTLLSIMPPSSKAFFENLNDSDWAILSFNGTTREACVILTTDSGDRYLSVSVEERR